MRVLLMVALASAVTGCGGTQEAAAPPPATSAEVAAAATTAAPACDPAPTRPLGSAAAAYAAVARHPLAAHRSPGGPELARFGTENVNGVPTVFGVLAQRLGEDCSPTWYRVQLPLRPNGVAGWVRAEDVELARVTTRIEVDLSERRVTLFDRGRPVLTALAAIGSEHTPTPTGRFYVNQRLIPEDPTGPFGPGAIGISAFSDVLTGWTQGGPIAIHGTNRPDLIGRAVSNGCIRVRNDLLRRLFDRALAGTPVTVRA